ncbi:copper chaperone PCu(A)C [Sphingomonas sp. 8AM]|uniref:copper chaperone PCu(A)C n=1 Tax=Sphingomonas sp. 8AM TaxID=2653170 RepID=UPI001F43BF33|nr:copper chaperone PCu(A)C [Sphingomonas sp. 8AM]
MAALILAAAGCSAQAAAPVADDAYVRLAAVPGRPAAGYFALRGGAKDTTLVRVEAPGVSRAEMHGSRMTTSGMVTMESLATVPVPAKTDVSFAPGGRHVMLFDLPQSAQAGSRVPLTLRFADGAVAKVEAKVIAAGDVAPE